MKPNFKKFLSLLSAGQKQPAMKRQMTIDRDQAEFELEVLINELHKRGFYARKTDWNLINGMIENRFQWAAMLGGDEQEHDLWNFGYVDLSDPPPQEVQRTEEMTPPQLMRSLEALRDLAKRTAKK